MPEPLNAPIVPPVTVISAAVKSVTVSLIVKVIVRWSFVAASDDPPFVIDTVGAVESITTAAFAPREFAAPGAGSVKTALLPDALLIVPPSSASEFVAT